MKITLLLLIAGFVPGCLRAQSEIVKTFPVQSGQPIAMHFDYPKLVQVSTWDRNEVSIQGTVSINGGEHDDAFIIESFAKGGGLEIRSYIKDLNKLPERITLYQDGQRMIFRDKAEFRKYQQEHGGSFNSVSYGADIEIVLQVKVPANAVTRIESVYGMVEVKDYKGPLTVEATYGGVDAALSEKSVGEMIAETNYGQIYTNWDAKFGGEGSREEDFHTLVVVKPGTGPKYTLESKYGNVYIRKALN
jgi:hypothetical protein